MRNAVTGFVLGYFVVALLIAPSLLWALGAAPNYTSGVVIVMKRIDVIELLQQAARQAVEFSNHIVWIVDDFLGHQVVPYLPSRN